VPTGLSIGKNMQVPFLDLKREYLAIKDEIDSVAIRVLESGQYIFGEEVTKFEQRFAEWLGAQHAVGVASGTEALHLALVAAGVEPGDGVITVPNTAVPTVSAIDLAGGRPVFVDVDPDTYTMSPGKLAETLADASSAADIKTIVPVHLYGHPADMDPILEIARSHGLKVVEDAAQATGATYKGRTVGTIGDFGCFSFYPTKNLGAYGDAGMVVTRTMEDAEKIKMLRNYGEEYKNRNVTQGFNSRLDAIQAAFLTCKLAYLDQWNEMRRKQARQYKRLLRSCELVLPTESDQVLHAFHLYVVRTKQRDEFRRFLAEKGVQTAVHYPLPVHFQEAYAHLGYAEKSFPVSERNAMEVVSLPCSPFAGEDEIAYVAETIHSAERSIQ
jgi:dTDP-4-amino-4,6-dideoxygalactose transaminase